MIEVNGIVKSMAGRDAGRFFVVLRVQGDFAWLADGKMRPLERPKKKRLKHLQRTNRAVQAEEMMTNHKLRRTLSMLNQENGNGALVT